MDFVSLILLVVGAAGASVVAFLLSKHTRVESIRMRANLQESEQARKDLDARLQESLRDTAVLRERRSHDEQTIRSLEEEKERGRINLARAEQEAQRRTAAESRLEELGRRLDALQAEAGEARQKVDVQTETIRRLNAALSEAQARASELEKQEEARRKEVFESRQKIEAQTEEVRRLNVVLTEAQTRVEEQEKAFAEQRELLARAEQQLKDAFKALSADALKSSSESFLQLARKSLETYQEQAKGDLEKRQQAVGELVMPLKTALEGVNRQVQEMEKTRADAYGALRQQVTLMQEGQQHLQKETANLVRALGRTGTRGKWGEIHLRRVVEMAGMVNYCDFEEQANIEAEGGRLRPDMIVRLPGQRAIVIDAKAPMDAYWEAVNTTDDSARAEHLRRHAAAVRQHLAKLTSKGYADAVENTLDFVVLFLPNETLFSAALEVDGSLLEYGMSHKVLIATPMSLMAMLQAVAYGWRQESIAENAKQISELGQDLYERLSVVAAHAAKVGKSLGQSVSAYNDFVGSMERRVLVAGRRFKDLGASVKADIAPLDPLDVTPRHLQAPELMMPLLGPEGEGDGALPLEA